MMYRMTVKSLKLLAPVEQFKIISEKLHAEKITPDEAGIRMIPTQEIELETDKGPAGDEDDRRSGRVGRCSECIP